MNPVLLTAFGLLIVVLIAVVQNVVLEELDEDPAGHLFGYPEKLYQDDGSRLFTRRLEHPPIVASGAPDFIVRDDSSEPVVLELKSGRRNERSFEGHRMQLLMYLWILKHDFAEPIKRGELIYLEDDSPEGRVPLRLDPAAEQELMEKLTEFYHFWYEHREQTPATGGGPGSS